MGGIRGKGVRKRAQAVANAKTFDRISGRFYDEKVAMPSGKVSTGEMLSAPKSFRRFLAAKVAAENRAKRREGVEDEVVEKQRKPPVGNKVKSMEADIRQAVKEEDDSPSEDDETVPKKGKITHIADIVPLTRAQPDKGNEKLREMDEQRAATAAESEKKKKKKYLSLRERKKRERAASRAEKREEEVFLSGATEEVRFGETAEAPPTITLKRKSGGKGEKEVPIAHSGHKIVEIAANQGGGKANRQSKIFQDLMTAATDSSAKSKKATQPQGLKRQADLAQLRAQVIADYRSMKGRPMHNGRNVKLATNPSKLFAGSSLQGVSGASLRKDRR